MCNKYTHIYTCVCILYFRLKQTMRTLPVSPTWTCLWMKYYGCIHRSQGTVIYIASPKNVYVEFLKTLTDSLIISSRTFVFLPVFCPDVCKIVCLIHVLFRCGSRSDTFYECYFMFVY